MVRNLKVFTYVGKKNIYVKIFAAFCFAIKLFEYFLPRIQLDLIKLNIYFDIYF